MHIIQMKVCNSYTARNYIKTVIRNSNSTYRQNKQHYMIQVQAIKIHTRVTHVKRTRRLPVG